MPITVGQLPLGDLLIGNSNAEDPSGHEISKGKAGRAIVFQEIR
jgi:hypothetical protein